MFSIVQTQTSSFDAERGVLPIGRSPVTTGHQVVTLGQHRIKL
jgi:hypothetical protein